MIIDQVDIVGLAIFAGFSTIKPVAHAPSKTQDAAAGKSWVSFLILAQRLGQRTLLRAAFTLPETLPLILKRLRGRLLTWIARDKREPLSVE
jgi:hypothetical protein